MLKFSAPKLETAGKWCFVGQVFDEVHLESLNEIGEYCFVQCTFSKDVIFSSLTKVEKGCFAGSKINANLIFPKLTGELPKNFAFSVQIKVGNFIQIRKQKFYSYNELVSKLNVNYDQDEINNDIETQKKLHE
ncbi:leucine-rich repeat protein [bacterium]|nr:leucine-rich repeat protein [bacterium]